MPWSTEPADRPDTLDPEFGEPGPPASNWSNSSICSHSRSGARSNRKVFR